MYQFITYVKSFIPCNRLVVEMLDAYTIKRINTYTS